MSVIQNPFILRPMDCLHCGVADNTPVQHRLFSMFTRIFSASFKKAVDMTVAIHTAIVIKFRNELLVAEMIGMREGLRISSLEVTHENTRRNVLGVSRYSVYDDNSVREAALDRIAHDFRKGIEYDPKGCLEFAFKRMKDDPKRLICSEYFYINAKLDGHKFPQRYETRVSPFDLQHYIDVGITTITGY